MLTKTRLWLLVTIPVIGSLSSLYSMAVTDDATEEAATMIPTEETPAPTPTPAPIPAATPGPTNPLYQQELSQINQAIQTISQDKSTLKNTLNSINIKLEEAKAKALDAHKKSLDILNQPTEAAAKGILEQINQNLIALTAAQKELEAGLFKEFETTENKIKTDMQTIQTNISKLQGKGVALKIAQASAAPEAEETSGKHRAFKSWFIREQKGPQEERVAPTFVHYIFYKLADVIAGAFHVIYATWEALKNALLGKPPTTAAAPATTTTTVPPEPPATTPTTPTTPTTAAAEPAAIPQMPTPGASAEPPVATPLTTAGESPAVVEQELRTKIDTHEDAVVLMLTAQQKLQTQYNQIERDLKAILLTLASNPVIKKDIPALDLIFMPNTTEPTWKKSVMNGVSAIIDTIAYAGNCIHFYIYYSYKTYIAPIFGKIKTDVENKLQEPTTQTQSSQTTPQAAPVQAPAIPAA